MHLKIFHRAKTSYLFIAFLLSFVVLSFSQQNPKNNFTEEEINQYTIEVFQDENMYLVLDKNSKRLHLITRFFNKQYSIAYKPQFKNKKFKNTSDLKLNNKYNKNLLTDISYNPQTFNPLKYKFPLNSQSDELYRVGNTDYVITIHKLD